MVIYQDATGPLIAYGRGILRIADLNPEAEIRWRMTRRDLLRLAWRFFRTAIKRGI